MQPNVHLHHLCGDQPATAAIGLFSPVDSSSTFELLVTAVEWLSVRIITLHLNMRTQQPVQTIKMDVNACSMWRKKFVISLISPQELFSRVL